MKLKAKFTLIVSLFLIIILTLIAFFILLHFRKSIKETIAQDQFRMVSILADDIDSKLLTAQQHIVEVAKTAPPDIMQYPEKAQAFLDNRPSLHSIFENHLYLFTPSGKIFVESPYVPGRRGLNFSFRQYIINTLKTNKPYISDPYISSLPHHHPDIMFTVPLFDVKGNMSGILGGAIDLMRNNFLGRMSTVGIGKTGYFYLTATDRTLIMHPDKKRILTKQAPGLNRLYDKAIEGFEGTDETITSYRIKMVSSFKRMKVKNWILCANYPQSEAYLPIRQAEQFLLMTTVIAFIGIFFIISYIIKYLIKPLELFTRHIEELPQRTGNDRFLNIKTKDEIGTLSEAFNNMETKRQEVEDTLKKNQENLRQLIDRNPVAMAVTDKKEKFIFFNNNFIETFRYTLEDIPTVDDWWPRAYPDEKYRQKVINGWTTAANKDIKDGRQTGPQEWRVTCKDGSARDIEFRMSSLPDFNIIIFHDITARKVLERQLLQSQKMDAVGQLAGGIAHDFNNLLTSIIGYSDLELMKLPEDTATAKNLKIIRDAGEKAASLVNQILAFSRKQVLEMTIINLNTTVEDMGKLLARTIGENISLELNIQAQVRNIMADPGQIGQILLNLAVNARDAMPSGGRLTIETADVYLDEDFIKARQGVVAGNYVLLSVTDTGHGMSREIQDRIFEPFFTTKESGKGTGLGLSTVYGIVKQHNGYIWVYSEEGKGSTFKIYLPAVKGETREAEKPASIITSGTETILVVDDEPDIRRFVFDMLQPLGYKVLDASCADEALRIGNESQDKIDLLLTDFTMPGMNGLELRESFLKKWPGIKVIVMSGYGDEAITSKSIKKNNIIFMQKPLTYRKLTTKLRDVLDTK